MSWGQLRNWHRFYMAEAASMAGEELPPTPDEVEEQMTVLGKLAAKTRQRRALAAG